MENRLIRGIALNDSVRLFGIDCTKLVEDSRKQHDLWPTSCAALGRIEAVACMMASMLKDDNEKITININGNGPIGTCLVVAGGNGDVKGFVGDNQIYLKYNDSNKLAVGIAVGKDGFLDVTRYTNLKDNFNSKVRLISGEIGDDFSYYFNVSEQTPSVVSVGVLVDPDYSVHCAGGLIIQLLPDASEEIISKVEKVAANMRPITNMLADGMTIDEILMSFFDDVKILESKEFRWHCDCSRERFMAGISTLSEQDIQEMIDEDNGCEVKCEYCNTIYKFTKEDLESILEFKRSCLR